MISDHSLPPIEYVIDDNERELIAFMQAQLRFRLVAENARNHARELYQAAERAYFKHNRTLDGKS